MDIDKTISTSKGVFVFKNGCKKSKPAKGKAKSSQNGSQSDKLWYGTYKSNWKYFDRQIMELNETSYNTILNDIVDYIRMCYDNKETDVFENLIPSLALVTGVNQPDNTSQYHALIYKLRCDVTPHVAIVYSQHAMKVKQLVENVVLQLMHGDEEDLMEGDDWSTSTKATKIKAKHKSLCSMAMLKKWHLKTYGNMTSDDSDSACSLIKPLVIILPEFESFICDVLQEFVMILSSYTSVLPIMLVFGVATSVSAVHKSFPYHVSSKLMIKVFHSHTSQECLNQVIDRIILNHKNPFHLSAKVFQMLTNVFLFHDFSVIGFIQNVKYCMKYHTFWDDTKALCCEKDRVPEVLLKLTAENIESLRQLPSFRPFLEAQDPSTKIALFEDEHYFKRTLIECIDAFYDYLFMFYTSLRVLSSVVKELPRNSLGKSVQELYIKCSSMSVTKTQAFDECMQLLSFQSQAKLEKTVRNALKILTKALNLATPKKPLASSKTNSTLDKESFDLGELKGQAFINTVETHLIYLLDKVQRANIEVPSTPDKQMNLNESGINENISFQNRYQLKEKLLQSTKVHKLQSEFEIVRTQFVNYLKDMFSKSLVPFDTQPFYEIFVFGDVANVEKQIIGSPHGAIHSALQNPVEYLQCSCCTLPSEDSVVPSLPDTSIVYKLHLECGKLINLYDWLQAFAAVLDPSDDDARNIPPYIQARFHRAVSVLHYHGYIKSSKRKPDHVIRLTW